MDFLYNNGSGSNIKLLLLSVCICSPWKAYESPRRLWLYVNKEKKIKIVRAFPPHEWLCLKKKINGFPYLHVTEKQV